MNNWGGGGGGGGGGEGLKLALRDPTPALRFHRGKMYICSVRVKVF